MDKKYMANDQTKSSPPMSVQASSMIDNLLVFLMLYVTTLFSFDSYSAAQNSPYSTPNRPVTARRFGPSGSSAGSGSRPRPGGGSGGGGSNVRGVGGGSLNIPLCPPGGCCG